MKCLLICLLLLVSCNSTPIKLSEVEDCTFLSSSIFCIDNNIKDESHINKLKDRARKNTSLSEVERLEIIEHFENEKENIIETKSFELSISYHKYFMGYTLIPSNDRATIEKEVIDYLKELSELRRRCKRKK